MNETSTDQQSNNMNLEEARDKVRQAIKENRNYDSDYEIDEGGIIETDFAWYIPFRDIRAINIQDLPVGAYYGFIIGKMLGDLHRPGSAYSIEKWLLGYELGLSDGPHDLVITKINDRLATRKSLKRLNLTYFKPELENGITWKIPKNFTDKMIDERMANIPCKFKNQRFAFQIDTFKEIRDSRIFEYELVKTVDEKVNEIGERIE